MKDFLVLKIGTSTLTAGTDRISYAKIEDIVRQIIVLQKNYNIILVSSGSIAAAKQFVEINGYNKNVDSKQAMAAIGQPKLMGIYDEVFGSFGLNVAQCLLTYRDFEDDSARINTRKTIHKLIEYDYIPIINENDTVAIEEIVLGDNDKLSALVAVIIEARLLAIASDIDGLHNHNPNQNKDAELIKEVTDLSKVVSCAKDYSSELGTGGMTSKLQAAEICKEKRIEMWIVNGRRDNFLVDALKNKIPFTRFKL